MALEEVRVNPRAGLGEGVPEADLDPLKNLPPLPSQFEFLANDVPVNEPAGLAIKALVNESLPNWGLVRVRRFANKALWAHYVTRRDLIGSGCDFGVGDASNPNVKLLWHGTKEPVQILGSGFDTNTEGFDPRRSTRGEYGAGCYFASCASYPVKIHPRRSNSDGTFTLILAEVACGDVDNWGNATFPMGMPGVGSLPADTRIPREMRQNKLFESTFGTENSVATRCGRPDVREGGQYVAYLPDQAYPHFVVEVRPPPPPRKFRVDPVAGNRYFIKQVNHVGRFLSAHGHVPSGDYRDANSSWAMVHDPTNEDQWELEHVRGREYKIKLCTGPERARWRGSTREQGRYLAAHGTEANHDTRNDHSTWAMVVEDEDGRHWPGEWELIPCRNQVYKIKLCGGHSDDREVVLGRYLAAHGSLGEDHRNDYSTRAMVHGAGGGWEGEWEFLEERTEDDDAHRRSLAAKKAKH